jgi:hypothetical protein
VVRGEMIGVVRRRFLCGSALLGLLMVIQAGSVGAQIPDPTLTTEPPPIDAVEGPGGPDQSPPEPSPEPTPEPPPTVDVPPADEPPPEVNTAPQETTPEAAAADPATGGVVETIADAGGGGGTEAGNVGTVEAPNLAQTVEEAGAALGSEDSVAAVEESVVRENPELGQAIAEVASEVGETIQAGTAPEVVPGDAATAAREGGGKTLSRAGTTQALKSWAESGGAILSSLGGIFGLAQPQFAILVDAMNDADGDGNFTDAEIAPIPSADVRFEVLVSNIGSTNFEIAGVSHTYTTANGPVQVQVCEKLTGLALLAGESVPCTFSLAEYAPARGQSVMSTITAAAFEINGPQRGASDSDTSTVDTLLEDEVLAVAVSRKPGVLAFTGMDAAGLIVLALTLLASGAALTHLSRRRRLRLEPEVPVNPWLQVELMRWRGGNGQSSASASSERIRP